MSRLTEWLAEIEKQGYHGANARARLCQDIVLEAISKGRLRRNVTIKGGVVMRSLTGDVRRATQDMDIDFIRYSLADDSIQRFIQDLNVFDDFHIAIAGAIDPLRHQDYHGKCVNIRIYDSEGTIINSKIDFGVHKDLTIQQEEYCPTGRILLRRLHGRRRRQPSHELAGTNADGKAALSLEVRATLYSFQGYFRPMLSR